jgi:hypothetical protein
MCNLVTQYTIQITGKNGVCAMTYISTLRIYVTKYLRVIAYYSLFTAIINNRQNSKLNFNLVIIYVYPAEEVMPL